ncbi:MAG: hypothetical protein DDT26_00122 [Dehalococcoidia bacterium]|nr:hypothetical protein [Chloroflexota bacterium]
MSGFFSDEFNKHLVDGLQFEQYVYEWLEVHRGTRIKPCDSEYLQIQVGENYFGLEIKLDRNFRKTGNLFIETEERRTTDKRYYPSGIYRIDNSWLYGIGDFDGLYVFDKVRLRKYVDIAKIKGRHRFVEIAMKTSVGMLLPLTTVAGMELAADTWDLCPVTADQLNKARGFKLPEPKKLKPSVDQASLFPELIQASMGIGS